jgi:hypothetical protein
MRHHPRRLTTALSAAVVLALILPASPGAADDVGESLCTLFTKKQVREAFGHRAGNTDEVRGKCVWGLVDTGDYGADLQLHLDWEDVSFDDLGLLQPEATALTVEGRRALFSMEQAEVRAKQGGVVTRDVLWDLVLDLDPGPLRLHITDPKGKDWQSRLVGLGELAVRGAASLLPPPVRDEAVVALLPATIGGEPTMVRTIFYPGQEFCSDCDFGKTLRNALEAQGKTMADVSMVTAATAAGSSSDSIAPPPIRALRVPGSDATAFVEAMIGYLFGGTGVTPERTEGTGVVAVTRRADQYNAEWTSVLYPSGEILWVVTAPEPVRAEILAALPGAPVPPPVPTPAPTPTPDISTPEGYLKSLLPATLGGEGLVAQVFMAKDILPPDAQKVFKAALKAQGKSIDDVAIVAAAIASGTQLQGWRIAGGDAAPLEDAFVKFLKDSGQLGKKAEPEPTDISGKSVRHIKAQTGDGYLYPKDDVLWVVMAANEADLTEVFAALP